MTININIISDTGGRATEHLVNKTMVQFNQETDIHIYPYIQDFEALESVLNYILVEYKDQILYYSVQDSKMNVYIYNFCELHHIPKIDVMSYSINSMAEILGESPKSSYDNRSLYDTDFYKKMNALDFALKYDDGKDFRALETCDVALIGVSRSSKTPLSMYMASKGYKVSNIPILLGTPVPRELYEIDNEKIFGLTIDKNVLREYRIQRLKSLNLSEKSQYSDLKRIQDELIYANEIMQELECNIIDMTNRSIEEASDLIVNKIKHLERGKKVD